MGRTTPDIPPRDPRREDRQPGVDEGPEAEEILADEEQTKRQAGIHGGFGIPASDDRV